jgi:hypothetical protein
MQTAGVILDIYDDTKGLVLREKLAGSELPPTLSGASLLPQQKLAELPDRLFALVAKNGDAVLRKYAMHDAEHLTTSVVYFLECGHILPEPAQKVAAINLVRACEWYDIKPPEPLVKKAVLGKAMGTALLGLGAVGSVGAAKEGMSKNKSDMDRYRQIQVTGQVPPQGSHIKHATLFDDMMSATGAKAPPSAKTADLVGTEMMPAGGSIETKPMRTNTAKRRSNSPESKNASLVPDQWVGPIDITGLGAPVATKEATYENFCLPSQYPIDSYGQVKQAEAYFNEHWGAFDLPERRTYALNLVDRANELGVKVAGRVLDYAGRRVGLHLRSELQKRAMTYEGHPQGGVYEELKAKIASISPEDMVGLLDVADGITGAKQAYDRPVVGFRDPFASVFGVKVAKEQITGHDDAAVAVDPEAENEYAWNLGSDYVTGDQLRAMSNRNEELDGVLGEGFSAEFTKDPVGTFKALPDPQKHVLARLASDNSGGTVRQ